MKSAAIGDVDRDGHADVLIHGRDFAAFCASGRTGARVWTSPAPWIGVWSPATAIGDVDADGWPDLAIAGPLPPTYQSQAIDTYSGKSGVILRRATMDQGHPNIARVAGAGDVDGDSIPDVLATGPGWLTVFSGKTLSSLVELPCPAAGLVAKDMAFIGDVDADGRPDVVVSWGENHFVGVYSPAVPEYFTYGQGCRGSGGVPTLRAAPGQVPRINAIFELLVSNLPPLAPTFLSVGLSNANAGPFSLPLELSLIGMPNCWLYQSADLTLPVLNVSGTAKPSMTFGNNVDLLGRKFWNQVVVLDASANLLGVSLSGAGEGRVGR